MCGYVYVFIYTCSAYIYYVYIHIYVNMCMHTDLIVIHFKHKLPTRCIYFIDTVIFSFSAVLQKITPWIFVFL